MKKKGFTLVEMLVVIVILGIVLTIVIPNVVNLMNKGTNQKYEKLEKVVVEAAKVYAINYQGNLVDVDRTSGLSEISFADSCWNVPYSTLVKEELIQEEDITCSGSIIVSRREKSGYDAENYLTCKDKKGNIVHESNKALPTKCLGFGGNFELTYKLYQDEQMTQEYKAKVDDEINWQQYVYGKYESTSPYNYKIVKYQYSKDLLNWIDMIDSTMKLTDKQTYTNFNNSIYVRAIDAGGNISTIARHLIYADSFKPEVVLASTQLDLGKQGYDYTKNVTAKFGLRGGTVTCDPSNSDKLGDYTVNCKALGVNGIETNTSFRARVDITPPTIKAKKNEIILTKLDYNYLDNIESTYGILGGTTTCDPKTSKNDSQKTVTVTCTAKANNGQSKSITFTAKVDDKEPVLKANSSPLSLGIQDYNFIDNVNVTFGYLGGGKVTCDPPSTKKSGIYTVTCTVTGNNGLTSTLQFTARHSYAATKETKNAAACKWRVSSSSDSGQADCGSDGTTIWYGLAWWHKTYTDDCGATTSGGQSNCGASSSGCYPNCPSPGSASGNYKCDSGWTKSGSTCYKYSCPNGGTLSGTTCVY